VERKTLLTQLTLYNCHKRTTATRVDHIKANTFNLSSADIVDRIVADQL